MSCYARGVVSSYLSRFDGVESSTVFYAWTGTNDLSDQRVGAMWSIMQEVRCPMVFLTCHSMRDWQYPGIPFHPAFDSLSDTHKADYLRCYLMHHYGGGYTDIKVTTKRWDTLFETFRHSDKLALGYREVGPGGVAVLPGAFGKELRDNYASLIGLCAFMFRKRSALTTAWFTRTTALLDQKLEDLHRHPAQHPQDKLGVQLSGGAKSQYPLRWTELLGDIFHPVIYEYKSSVLHADIAPQFHSYR